MRHTLLLIISIVMLAVCGAQTPAGKNLTDSLGKAKKDTVTKYAFEKRDTMSARVLYCADDGSVKWTKAFVILKGFAEIRNVPDPKTGKVVPAMQWMGTPGVESYIDQRTKKPVSNVIQILQ